MTAKQNKDEAVRVRLTIEEKEAFTRLAKKLGETPSRVHRRLIREAVSGHIDLFDSGVQQLVEAANQVAALGRNLNQIARAVNEGRVVADPITRAEMTALQEVISGIDRSFRDVIKRSKDRTLGLRVRS